MHETALAAPLASGAEWTFPLIKAAHAEIEEIALGEFGLDVYPSEIEVITSEQMLDRYASSGLPFMYRHWSFGKHFAAQEQLYRRGVMNLAYEIVINTNPCLVYLMEENTMMMQALTIAHAAFGHNHFFKHNHRFKGWTDAEGILGYLSFARDFIAQCEEKHGVQEVERVLDAAHALQNLGVDRAPRPLALSFAEEQKRQKMRLEAAASAYNDLYAHTIPRRERPEEDEEHDERSNRLNLPEENILYFVEEHAPGLEPWEREIVRIARNIAQYFYPQQQTQVVNEGCATFVHYEVIRRLYEKGLMTEGAMMEFLQSHTAVIRQVAYDHPAFRSTGINPYALGFAMMRDIRRIAAEPTEEDRMWFRGRDFVGTGDPWDALRHAWADFRDEDFIQQYLSPKVIRDFKFFSILDSEEEEDLVVNAIQNERGYRKIRELLASQYDLAAREPDIRVVDADLAGDRILTLHHTVHNGVLLDKRSVEKTLGHLVTLWGYEVELLEIDSHGDVLEEHHAG